MNIYRKNPIGNIYAGLPFVRVGKGAFVDSTADIAYIKLFQECAEGKRCISEMETQNRIIIKVDVPSEVLNSNKHSGEVVEFFIYYWTPADKHHVSDPGRHLPFEAVSLKKAGIDTDYLLSISDGLLDGDEKGISSCFVV